MARLPGISQRKRNRRLCGIPPKEKEKEKEIRSVFQYTQLLIRDRTERKEREKGEREKQFSRRVR